ncbi:MAG TPA: hypothetical protein VJO32_05900 [Ktedonobacteraceae bacterium]|nr:hypothetical protein [Ktedonobacteraceae bacterium]
MSTDTNDNSNPPAGTPAAPNPPAPNAPAGATATAQPSGPIRNALGGISAALGARFATRKANKQARQAANGSNLPATTSNDEIAAQIEQVALESGTPLATIVAMLAGQTQDVERVVASYDDEKEHPIGKVVGVVVTILCYGLPWLIAFYAGYALGFTYSGGKGFDPRQMQNAYYYIVSWGYEFTLCSITVGMVRQFKRIRGSGIRKAIPLLSALLIFFLVLSITSACAQWILFESHINTHDASQVIGAIFRTAGAPLIDAAAAIVLAVLFSISLDQHLDTIQKKNDATIAINRKKIQSRLEVISSAMEVKNTLQKEEDYQKKNALANTIIGLMSESAIDAIRDSLAGKKQDTGNSYRRDTYR